MKKIEKIMQDTYGKSFFVASIGINVIRPSDVKEILEKHLKPDEPQMDCIHNFDGKQGGFNTVVVNKCTKCGTYGKER